MEGGEGGRRDDGNGNKMALRLTTLLESHT